MSNPFDVPKIMLDLDGVIVDLLGTAIARCGIPLPFDGYSTAPAYAIREWGLNKREKADVSAALYDPTTALEAKPHDGAIDAWRIFERLGEIYVVTSRAPRYQLQTYSWLERHNLDPVDVVFASEKGEVAKQLGITIALDDSPKNLIALWRVDVPHIFRPDYPYNAKAPGNPYRSWAHLFQQAPLAQMLEEAIAKEAADSAAPVPEGLVS